MVSMIFMYVQPAVMIRKKEETGYISIMAILVFLSRQKNMALPIPAFPLRLLF
jgi:hypothetical protein